MRHIVCFLSTLNCLKKTICTLLALWTPIVFAYTNLTNSDGETSSPAVAPIMGILLNEDGEPRCKILEGGNEFFYSFFDDFIETNPDAIGLVDQIDALPECNSHDFIISPDMVLGTQFMPIPGITSQAGNILTRITTGSGVMGRRLIFFIPSLLASFGYGCMSGLRERQPYTGPPLTDPVAQFIIFFNNYPRIMELFSGAAIGALADVFINGDAFKNPNALLFHGVYAFGGGVACNSRREKNQTVSNTANTLTEQEQTRQRYSVHQPKEHNGYRWLSQRDYEKLSQLAAMVEVSEEELSTVLQLASEGHDFKRISVSTGLTRSKIQEIFNRASRPMKQK